MEIPGATKKEVVTAFRTREILTAARRLLAQRTLENITMDDIAQEAGVAKGTIYLYFSSKDELIQDLLSEVGEALARKVEALVTQNRPAPDRLRELISLFLRHVEQERVLFPIYLRELVRSRSGRETRLSPKLRELDEKIVGLIARLLTEGQEEGCFVRANPRLIAYLFKGMVRTAGYLQMTGELGSMQEEALPVILQLLFSGIVLAGPNQGKPKNEKSR